MRSKLGGKNSHPSLTCPSSSPFYNCACTRVIASPKNLKTPAMHTSLLAMPATLLTCPNSFTCFRIQHGSYMYTRVFVTLKPGWTPYEVYATHHFLYAKILEQNPVRELLACENIRFSSLFAAGDVSRGGTSATQRQKFHTDDVKSVRYPVRSADWSTEKLHCFSYCLPMTDERPQRSNANAKRFGS